MEQDLERSEEKVELSERFVQKCAFNVCLIKFKLIHHIYIIHAQMSFDMALEFNTFKVD